MRIVSTVTNDLTYDQRMNRICSALVEGGHESLLVGRTRSYSKPLEKKSFEQERLTCWFNKGKLFYLEYNIRLLFFLLRVKCDVINVIDLDTMPACYLAARMRNKPIVYDAHEYFTELEEVVGRPLVYKMWSMIEAWSVPNIKFGYTVSQGYADLFKKKYGVDYAVVRNVTVLRELPVSKKEEPYILYQGSVNVGRGLEALIPAMRKVDAKLIVCGLGNLYDECVALTEKLGLQEKIIFKGYVEPSQLPKYTINASVGITLFSNDGLSNQYSLANRFFDYFHHGVPQLAMDYPEYRRFNESYEVAYLVKELSEDAVAEGLNKILNDSAYAEHLRNEALKAREEHNFQADKKVLLNVYRELEESIEK